MAARLGSMCSGAGMLDLAAAAVLDVEPVWHAETDPAASKVLAAHWPGVPNHGDITAVDWSSVEPVDALAGGIPCQPWSMSGKRRGSDDERDLWPVRKLDADGRPRRGAVDAIRALMPGTVLLENVAGLLSMEHGTAFGTILADLDEVGYTVRWTTVGACRVGFCHHRHRVFIAATLGSADGPAGSAFAWRAPSGWVSTQGQLFGDTAPVEWPQAGVVVGGEVWGMAADVCGANGIVLPTPRANADRTSRRAATAPHSRSAPSLEQAVEIAQGILPRELRSWDEAPASWLPTPRATDTGTPGRQPGEGFRPPLSAVLLPTPTARVADGRGHPSAETAAQRMADGRRNLEDAVALLPTPTARDAERGAGWGTQPGRPLSEVIVDLLPTPTARDGMSGPGHAASAEGTPDLRTLAAWLPTPRASDASKDGPNQRGSSGDVMLPAAVQPERWGAYAAAVHRQELLGGVPAPEPTEPGRLGKPRLTAALPEWMMGVPPGWITAHVGRGDAIRIAGNGVVWQAGAHAYGLLLNTDRTEAAA